MLLTLCPKCNDDIDPMFGCRCITVTPPRVRTVAVRGKKIDPDAHLGASEESFEKGWHPLLDVGVDTC